MTWGPTGNLTRDVEAPCEGVWNGQKSWNGVAILARGDQPVETRRGLPGDPDDTHSRYIEAAVDGMIVGCLYLPERQSRAGAKVRLQASMVRPAGGTCRKPAR